MSLEKDGEAFSFKKVNGGSVQKALGTKVQISRYVVPVIYCVDLIVDGDTVCGAYDYVNKEIYINVSVGNPIETFFHEVFHAEIIEGGIRQHPKWCIDTEEIVVELLSRCIAFGFSTRKR